MRAQRLKTKLLAIGLILLFGALALWAGYCMLNYSNRWFASSKNPRVRAQKENVIAGSILDRSGTPLAWTDADGSRVYQAELAAREAVVHLVGDSQGQVGSSVESFQTSYLYGFQAPVWELFSALWNGESRRGDDVTLTISAPLCTEISRFFDLYAASRGKRGAAVVMNWRTGEVLAQVSRPGFDPMRLSDSAYLQQLTEDSSHPFWNRVTQSVYPPGSTFKIVTAAAALSQLEDAQTLVFDCEDGALPFAGGSVTDYSGGSHGLIDLRTGFVKSCNKLFATLAVRVGQQGMAQAAADFGFGDNFLFRDLVVMNSRFPDKAEKEVELAASGFGQSSVGATPLHLCMIAAGIANGGVMQEPRLLRAVTGAGGAQRLGFTPAVYRTAVSPETAAILKDYMRGVITGGTGSRASAGGMTICGKTGTSDSTEDGSAITYGWFTGFNDDEALPIALCVMVEDIGSGESGGTAAAPVAREIFQWCRQHASEIMD